VHHKFVTENVKRETMEIKEIFCVGGLISI